MKHFLIILVMLSAGFFARAADPVPNNQLVQIYFAGSQKISLDPESTAFTNIFCCPEARQLEAETLDKLARFPRVWLKDQVSATAIDGSDLLRPLFNDLVTAEWHLTVNDSGERVPEFVLAVRLPLARQQVWGKNLATVLQSWTGIAPQPTSEGWEIRKHVAPVSVRFERFEGWVIFSASQPQMKFNQQLLMKRQTMPWLAAEINWAKLMRLLPDWKLSDLPTMQMEVSGHSGDLMVKAQAVFSGAAPVLLTPWQLPANSIQNFVSFTAARGFEPWLQEQSWYQPYKPALNLNQFFAWALPQAPFQTYLAAPCSTPKQALQTIAGQLEPVILAGDESKKFVIPFKLTQTDDKISLTGAPYISPYIQSIKEPTGQFLLGGVFPRMPGRTPLPKPLLAQLNNPELLYYHWEITSQRMPELLNLSQLGLLLTGHRQLDANSAAFKWLNRIQAKLGPSTMGVYLSGPNVLTAVQTAPAGFTAVELYALANWLEAPNFPGCDLRMPSRIRRIRHAGAVPNVAPPMAPPLRH